MKKTGKRFGVFALALVMVLTLARNITVFAAVILNVANLHTAFDNGGDADDCGDRGDVEF